MTPRSVVDNMRLWARPLPANAHLLMCAFCDSLVPWNRPGPRQKCEDCGFNGANGPELLSRVWKDYAWAEFQLKQTYATPPEYATQQGSCWEETRDRANMGGERADNLSGHVGFRLVKQEPEEKG